MMRCRPKNDLRALMCGSICMVLVGCAGLDTRLPEISALDLAAETQMQEATALRQIEDKSERLLRVGWPILTANVELCPKSRPAIGVKMHSLKSYPKRLRSSAGRVLGADDTLRILHITKGGPADVSGLQRGDIILDDNGQTAGLDSEAWTELLRDNTLNVRRGKETLSVAVDPVSVCDYALKLSSSGAINAYADGRNITMTTAMMDFVESDEELALIIGHELGHNTMGHIRKIVGNFIFSFGGTRYTRPFESEADYVGLYYLERAGYSTQGVEDFWRRLAKVSPKSINRAKTHPTFPDRYLRIQASRDEIDAKQSDGKPLLPNFKNGANPSGT